MLKSADLRVLEKSISSLSSCFIMTDETIKNLSILFTSVSAISALITAICTGLYLRYTAKLAGIGTKTLAETKTMFDLANRPYLHISSISAKGMVSRALGTVRLFELKIENFGKLPATIVHSFQNYTIINIATGTSINAPTGESKQNVIIPPGSNGKTMIEVPDSLWSGVRTGDLEYHMTFTVDYKTYLEQTEKQSWKFKFDITYDTFIPL